MSGTDPQPHWDGQRWVLWDGQRQRAWNGSQWVTISTSPPRGLPAPPLAAGSYQDPGVPAGQQPVGLGGPSQGQWPGGVPQPTRAGRPQRSGLVVGGLVVGAAGIGLLVLLVAVLGAAGGGGSSAVGGGGDGTWDVGAGMAPGTYRVAEPITGYCYWEITRTGSDGADIQANQNTTGGRPSVVLREGSTFKSDGCGTWQPATAGPASMTTFGEGTWDVGVDVAPGTFKLSEPPLGSCYWEISRTGSNGQDIVSNDNVTGGQPSITVTAGQTVYTSGCGTWQSSGAGSGTSAGPGISSGSGTIGDGVWDVGVDVSPGTYRLSQPVLGSCYWQITRTGSNGADIISNDNVTEGQPTVLLSAGQTFKSDGCGTWQPL